MAPTTVEQELDGTSTEYEEIPVEGDHVERLMTELFTAHWPRITVGPLLQGAVWEIRFTAAPRVTMLDGYLTVDTGAWHFHLCVGDTRGQGDPALARATLARAAASLDPELRFRALYNLGLLALLQSRADSANREALLADAERAYREALDIDRAVGAILEQVGKAFDRRVVVALINYLDNRGGRAQWAAVELAPAKTA